MKKQYAMVVFLPFLTMGNVYANETSSEEKTVDISGSIALLSDYRFRGQSQTQNRPALQGTLNLEHQSGFYVGLFASNVNFGEDSNARLEFDPSIGYQTKLPISASLQPTLDVGVARYQYSGGDHSNYHEFYTHLAFENTVYEGDTLTTSVNYSPNLSRVYGKSWNVGIDYTVPIADTGFGLVSSVGYSKFKTEDFLENGDRDFIDYKLGVTRVIYGVTAELDFVGTNIDTHDYEKKQKQGVDRGVVFSLTKEF